MTQPTVTPTATTGTINLDLSKGCGFSIGPMTGDVTQIATDILGLEGRQDATGA